MANVAIRFSVENAETVRQALQALGKDGEKALKQLETGTAAPNTGLSALSSLVDAAKARFLGLATSIGPAGTALVQLGPAGLAAAAAIGFLSQAFNGVLERANAVAEWARKVREAAETAGVTAEQFQALARAGQRVGMDLDRTSNFLDRLTLSVEQLRQGNGTLFDSLARIDVGLVREVAAARTTAEAITVLANAYARLDSQAQRNAFATAIGGRGAIGAGQLLEQIAGAGGLAGLEEGARRAGRVIEGETLERMVRLRRETEELEKAATKAWDRFWGMDALARQREWADVWRRVAEYAASWADAIRRGASASSGEEGSRIGVGGNLALGPQGPRRPDGSLPPPFSVVPPGFLGPEPFSATVTPMNWAAELAIMRRWASVLGDALTPAEQLELRTIELTVALQSGAINAQQYARAIGAFTRAQDAASTATRNRLGIVTQEETLTTRLRELDDLQARGYIRNAEERALAERLVQREVRETMEALRVRASETPALTRLALDAQNLQKTLDQSLAGALRGTTSTILEMAKGTKTLGQGFGELAERIAAAVAEAILLRTVVAPLANATIGALGLAGVTAPNALGNVFAVGNIIPFARGGVVHRPSIFRMANGGLASMSEVEPEAVMPLRRLSSGRLGVEAVGGGGVHINIINNHASARVTQREERDGRGGRRLQIQIEEMVAAAAARPGSPVPRALAGSGALVRL
jgi:hypothetical protein